MSKALVAIGVSNAPDLDPLPGAVGDAEKIAAWARRSGYEHVKEFTDRDRQRVSALDISAHIKGLLQGPARERLDHLVIYFSGHGLAPFPAHEAWLLSDWNVDGNEAINASISVQYAQATAKPRISFIADACRTTKSTPTNTLGLVILPKPSPASGEAQVDQFYATRFGNVAQEFQPAELLASYGIFGGEVLKALEGSAAIDRNGRRVVTSRSLEDYLDEAVPSACRKLQGAAVQFPDTTPQWKPVNDVYAEFDQPPRAADWGAALIDFMQRSGPQGVMRYMGPLPYSDAASRKTPRWPELPPLPDGLARGRKLLALPGRMLAAGLNAWDSAQYSKRIRREAERYRATQAPRDEGEIAISIEILGAEVKRVVLSGGHEASAPQSIGAGVRIYLPTDDVKTPLMAAIELASGPWSGHSIAVPVFPYLIATALIDENGFSSLNYRMPHHVAPPDAESRALDEAVARGSAMFRRGVMPDQQELDRIIDVMRRNKARNPALAVLAAHICHRLGRFDSIADMENYEIGVGAYTPFDLVLLSGRAKPLPYRMLVGRFPFLSRGWGLLAGSDLAFDRRLPALACGITPSLWTMATPEVAGALAEMV